MLPKLLTELVGTFLFLTVIALSGAAGTLAPIPIGLALAAMVYMGGHVSGAHYNPAVSFGLFLRRVIDSRTMLAYWVAQLAGAVLAFTAGNLISGHTPGIHPGADATGIQAVSAEVIFTAAGPRGAQRGGHSGHGRELVLRSGHRIDSDGWCVRRRSHLRRSIQSCSGPWRHLCRCAVRTWWVVGSVDLHRGAACRRRDRRRHPPPSDAGSRRPHESSRLAQRLAPAAATPEPTAATNLLRRSPIPSTSVSITSPT